MLFTGIIAALIARFYDHRPRQQPSDPSESPRERDEDEPAADKPDSLSRNC